MPSDFLVRNAKYLFLTYPQIPDDDDFYWGVLDQISSLDAECIIGRERHSDGGLHLHVLCQWIRSGGFSTRNARAFDFRGRHPNIERVGRTPWKVWDYACKDGDIVAGGLARPSEESSGEGGSAWEGEYTSKWAYIADAATKSEFFDRLLAEDPRAFACSYSSIAKFADWKYKPAAQEYCSPADFEFNLDGYPELRAWVDDTLCDECTEDR